jgi:hypothetical protein
MSGFSVPQFAFFNNGQVAANGSVYVYQTGTTTTVTVYSDSGLTTPITNPINLDANGQCKFYVGSTVNLRMDAYTGLAGAGSLIESIDPVYPVGGSSSGFITEATLASASTTDLGTAASSIINISGSITITAFGSTATTAAPLYFLRFTGALTLTYNASSLILPSTANIITVAGDTCVAQYLGSGNWKVLSYNPISGKAVVSPTAMLTTKIQTFTITGTYTPSAGMLYCIAFGWGGGGGGGGCSGVNGAAAGGGSSGALAIKVLASAAVGASKAVTIGAGGTAGANTGGMGGTGGATILGATLLSAIGGSGGTGSTSASGAVPGGAGQTSTVGDVLGTGAPGGGNVTPNITADSASGMGGSTFLGGGGLGLASGANNPGNAGTANTGGGGSGATSGGSAQVGGVGGTGYMFILEFCSQ